MKFFAILLTIIVPPEHPLSTDIIPISIESHVNLTSARMLSTVELAVIFPADTQVVLTLAQDRSIRNIGFCAFKRSSDLAIGSDERIVFGIFVKTSQVGRTSRAKSLVANERPADEEISIYQHK